MHNCVDFISHTKVLIHMFSSCGGSSVSIGTSEKVEFLVLPQPVNIKVFILLPYFCSSSLTGKQIELMYAVNIIINNYFGDDILWGHSRLKSSSLINFMTMSL